MAQQSKIEWTKETWNPLAGCTAKSAGCLNCYAATMSSRLELMGQKKYTGVTVKKAGRKVFNGLINYDENALLSPLSIRKPDTFFVNSMSDLWWGDEEDLATARRLGVPDPQPVSFEFIDKVFAVMALSSQHTFQTLTKRPERMKAYFDYYHVSRDHNRADYVADAIAEHLGRKGTKGGARTEGVDWDWPLKNVWLGVSVEDQKTADQRIPLLLNTPAVVRWISAEPLLGPLDLRHYLALDDRNGSNDFLDENGWGYDEWSGGFTGSNTHRDSTYAPEPGIHLVVTGGESGAAARPMHPAWVRSLRDQCVVESEIAFFFKQWGQWLPREPACVLVDEDQPAFVGEWDISGRWAVHSASGQFMCKVGKKKAGRLLDGREWNEMPEVSK